MAAVETVMVVGQGRQVHPDAGRHVVVLLKDGEGWIADLCRVPGDVQYCPHAAEVVGHIVVDHERYCSATACDCDYPSTRERYALRCQCAV